MLEIFNAPEHEQERFRVAANKLLNSCFLIKKKADTKKDYLYVCQERELFKWYFELLGYQVRINEDQGVIALVNQYGTGRLQLTKYESIMLLLFRLLYMEKRKQLGTYSEEVIVLMEEVREKYAMLKVRAKPIMDKTMERSIISTFRRYNLVMNLDSDVTQADTRIIIYPSILMAVHMDDIAQYYEKIEEKLTEYAGGDTDGDTEEDIDQSEAD